VNCLNIEGNQIADRAILTSQLADDTCIFLKDNRQVPIILEALKHFSNASGLFVNQSKSEKRLGQLINKSPHERVENKAKMTNLFFEKCGGLNFLLSCDFKCSKFPIKVSNFHKQSLDAFK